jgi:hypothetical protein
MARTNTATALLCGLALSTLPVFAFAQTEPLLPLPPLPTGPVAPAGPGQPLVRGQSIVERSRPEVDALGVRLGSFFLFPRGEVDEVYNDNIFATASRTTTDFITVLAPSFDLLSNFTQHAVNVRGGASIGRFARHSSEDYDDAFGAVDGRFDLDANRNLYGGLRIDRLHEDRSSPDAPGNTAEPVRYTNYNVNAGYARAGLRIGYQADVAVRRQEYEAAPLIGGGTLFQSDRDVTSYEAALRGSYELVPNYQAFVRGAANLRAYDHSAAGSPTRNSNGFRIDAGARIDLTGVTYAEFYVGYLEQEYRASAFGTVRGLDAGGRLVWNVTQLTTVRLNAERTVQDSNNAALIAASGATVAASSPGYLHSTVSANVDHELLRNLLVNGNVGYANDDFKGISRTDNVFAAGVGARYLLSRNLYLGASYTYSHRDSSGGNAINPFTRNLVMLRISTQL